MTIHKFFRLCCLTVASVFWASCSADSNPQFVVPVADNSDSSSSEGKDSSSSAKSSSSKTVKSSSSVKSEKSSSSSKVPSSSSSQKPASSSSVTSSSSVSSSSESVRYVLAKDSSVTCEAKTYMSPPSCLTSGDPSCDDYKKYLGKDTSITEKILDKWESGLESCGAISLQDQPLYGIVAPACNPDAYYARTMFVCSNDSTYKNYVLEENRIYRNQQEYNEAHGISSSSTPQSSSSTEPVVQSCKQEGFALFADILADVQKELYKKIVKDLLTDTTLTEAKTTYLESLLDRTNNTLKGNFAPYLSGNYSVESINLKRDSKAWFDGYIAKTKTCAGGTPETTKRYQEKYNAILAESIDLINAAIAKAE